MKITKNEDGKVTIDAEGEAFYVGKNFLVRYKSNIDQVVFIRPIGGKEGFIDIVQNTLVICTCEDVKDAPQSSYGLELTHFIFNGARPIYTWFLCRYAFLKDKLLSYAPKENT